MNLKIAIPPSNLGTFAFTDGGSSFVDALETRQSLFGGIGMHFAQNKVPFSRACLKRLFELEDTFETLKIGGLGRAYTILPFAAKVDSLHYTIHSDHIHAQDLNLSTSRFKTLRWECTYVLRTTGNDFQFHYWTGWLYRANYRD